MRDRDAPDAEAWRPLRCVIALTHRAAAWENGRLACCTSLTRERRLTLDADGTLGASSLSAAVIARALFAEGLREWAGRLCIDA
jgi:hypothetical protein